MATLTQEMKDMIGAQLNFLATADEDGNPQVGPKGTLRVFSDHQLIYNEETGRHAWHNLQASGKVAVATVDRPALKGFRFEGTVEIHKDGKIFDDAQAFAQARHLPAAIAAVVIDVHRIIKLDAGPNAGTVIVED
ncbi:pyridoxamine 5'-phosphate oxidase family protein [Lacticaseibacillus mingshuiensis]|uniref:Pyridoxamine 5'-phosphate oxidase family protein n=1 Tax=Lacticaseibacillus mingshuiensis TaxID=2799574 RepID=A0ABW4CHY3_9LACO|nr:pyridoxamine 5'-phosphate oxidase family protein [Lacticaseibacillus mingshuiensis]